MINLKEDNIILLYTMTDGLGDYLTMGDIMRKVEQLLPGVKCLMVHRRNPHIHLWPLGEKEKRFFNIYSPSEFLLLCRTLQRERKKTIILGLQMAPGSIQGFSLYTVLKKLGALDYIVDFNLINADIILPPEGDYILDLHLNQIKRLLNVEIPSHFYKLQLPIQQETNWQKIKSGSPFIRIGIHPWNRRGHLSCFVWPFEKWGKTINFLLEQKKYEIIVFGRDKRFEEFKNYLKGILGQKFNQIKFYAVQSVQELIKTISDVDLILSVNTSVVHIGYALNKKMIILSGPSLNLWTPKGEQIFIVRDEEAIFPGSDRHIPDDRFPSIERIPYERVLEALMKLG